MVNEHHRDLLKRGAKVWNRWREENPGETPDLCSARLLAANLSRTDLRGANLCGACLINAKLMRAQMAGADLRDADLTGALLLSAQLEGADLSGAKLTSARFIRANLTRAKMIRADLIRTNFEAADLTEADLSGATFYEGSLAAARLINTSFEGAVLASCVVRGCSLWEPKLEGARQLHLIISAPEEPVVAVDSLEAALYLHHRLYGEGREPDIAGVAGRLALVLGNFAYRRRRLLQQINEALSRGGRLPAVVEFDKPASEDFNTTLRALTGMAQFIIADLTGAEETAEHLHSLAVYLEDTPVQLIAERSSYRDGLFDAFAEYPSFREPYRYESRTDLIEYLSESIIIPKAGGLEG